MSKRRGRWLDVVGVVASVDVGVLCRTKWLPCRIVVTASSSVFGFLASFVLTAESAVKTDGNNNGEEEEEEEEEEGEANLGPDQVGETVI